MASGRTVHYIDEGEPGWHTVLFLGGAGTSVRAFGLLEFARSLRQQLRIRVVSVERNGLGQTRFDPEGDPASTPPTCGTCSTAWPWGPSRSSPSREAAPTPHTSRPRNRNGSGPGRVLS